MTTDQCNKKETVDENIELVPAWPLAADDALLLYCAASKNVFVFSIGATYDTFPSFMSALHIKPDEAMVMSNRFIINTIN